MAAALHFVLVLFYLSAIQGQICPQPDFLPSVPDAASSKQCVFSHHCSKAKCMITQGSHKLTVILKLNWCQEPVTATVKLQQPESKLNWSGTLQDGEKTKLAVTPSMFSGDLPVSDSSLFVLVGLKKMKGNLLNYTVALVGNITAYDVVNPVNVVLLRGQTPVRSGKCGMIHGSNSSEKHSAEDHDQHPDEKPHNEDHEWHPDKKRHDQGTCSPARFRDGTVCPVTNHCSKITCTSPEDSVGGSMVLTVQINGCSGPLTATVTMGSSLTSEKWSHTFENGDKAEPPMPSGGGVKVHYELKAEWEKTNVNIKFKLTMSIEGKEESSEFGSVSILTAELALPKCAEESGEKCPKANFLPGFPTPQQTHCDFSNHCSKVTCITKDGGHKLTVGVEIKKCDDETHKATVSLKDPSNDVDWSYTLKDGEKVKLKVTPSMFSGGLPVSDASLFIKVGLKKMNGSNLNYTVWMVGTVTDFGEVSPVNVLLLQGISPVPVTTGDCGSLHNRQASSDSKWFSKQLTSVQVLVIFLPVLVLVLVGLGVAFYCYRNSGRGGRFPVHLTAGGSKVAMQRLTNEI